MSSSDPLLQRLIAIIALLGVLAGCGDLPRPFQPEAKTIPVVRPVSPEAAALMEEPSAVAVQPVINLPAEGGARLAAAMAVALRDEGIAADVDPRSPGYTLAGIANVRELPHELEVRVTWYLLDARGYRLTQQDQITRGRVEDWIEGNDRLISRIAQTQAPPLAALINMHVARANPPAATPATAAAPPPNGTNGNARAGNATASGTTAPPAAAPAPRQQQQAAAQPAGPQMIRVVVPRIDGAPGDGPDSLAAGMKRALSRRNFAILQRPDANSLTVRGKVEMKPFNAGRELITITWAVLDPQNKQVGEIEQSNVIPGGSLNGEWGPIAREITVAAAEGLLDLLEKASQAAR